MTSTGVPGLLAASLVIDQRKAAEQQLDALSVQSGFVPHLLQLVLERSQPVQIRQAACLYFKNQIKARWDDVSPVRFRSSDEAFFLFESACSQSTRFSTWSTAILWF